MDPPLVGLPWRIGLMEVRGKIRRQIMRPVGEAGQFVDMDWLQTFTVKRVI
jgi:hypothetical protein